MSAAGGILSRIVASLGGPQTAALIVAGGVVVGGGIGGAASAGLFTGSSATSKDQLAVYPCPNEGPALFTVPSGQKFLVTGRTADNAWLQIHNPLPGDTQAWIQANPVTVNGTLADVPVTTCLKVDQPAGPSGEPAPSLTAILNLSPSPGPTPSPIATATPNVRPSLAALTTSTRKVSYDTGGYCPTAVKKVTFQVKASDAAGVDGVTLFWREPGAASYAQSPMTRTAGSATNGTWQVTLDTTANGITSAGNLAFYAVATDVGGATRRIPSSGASTITVAVCANTGPTITAAKSSSGSSLYWDPLSVGKCQTATTISAGVNDVDGVASVTLFYRRPGDSAWSTKPMSNRAGTWVASLNTAADKITIPTPPTGSMKWYIKAVDGKGAASQTKTASITIRRCDTEAVVRSSDFSPGTMCSQYPTRFYYTLVDPDGIGPSSATFVYTYTLSDLKTTKTVRVLMTNTGGNDYQVSIAPDSTWTFRNVTMTYHVETVDRFGGRTSPIGSGKIQQFC